jgi:hypothetical protein
MKTFLLLLYYLFIYLILNNYFEFEFFSSTLDILGTWKYSSNRSV